MPQDYFINKINLWHFFCCNKFGNSLTLIFPEISFIVKT